MSRIFAMTCLMAQKSMVGRVCFSWVDIASIIARAHANHEMFDGTEDTRESSRGWIRDLGHVSSHVGDHAIHKMFDGAEDTGLRAAWQCFH